MSNTLKMNNKQKDQAARQLTYKVLGAKAQLRLINRGVHNDVYMVTKETKEKFVLRLGHPDFIAAYKQAHAAMAAARERGLPVPEVVLCGNTLVRRSYLITRFAEGVAGDEFSGDRLIVWRNIGELAEHINRIVTVGYGQHLFEKQRGEETWHRYIIPNIEAQLDFYSRWRGFNRASRKTFFNKDELSAIAHSLQPLRSLRLKPRLIHVDLAPRNVLVNQNGGITSVLDWDSAKSFPRPHQIAVLTFWLAPEEKQAFIRGYGRNFNPNIVKAFQIYESLTQIPYYYKQPALAKTARSIIRFLLDGPQGDSLFHNQIVRQGTLTQEA